MQLRRTGRRIVRRRSTVGRFNRRRRFRAAARPLGRVPFVRRRRRVNRRLSFKSGGKVSRTFRNKIYRAISPLHVYYYQQGHSLQVPVTNASVGFKCVYWNMTGSISADDARAIILRIGELVLNDVIPSITTTAIKPSVRYLQERTVHTYSLTNMSLGRVNLELYYLRFRKVLPNAESYGGIGGLVNLYQDGLYDNNLLGAGLAVDVANPALTPFQSARLTGHTHIYKVKKFTLHGGQNIKFKQVTGKKFVHGYDYFDDRSVANNPVTWDTLNVYVRGSKAILIKAWGTPASATPGDTVGTITGTSPELDIQMSGTIDYRVVHNPVGDMFGAAAVGITAPSAAGPSVVAEYGQIIVKETEA